MFIYLCLFLGVLRKRGVTENNDNTCNPVQRRAALLLPFPLLYSFLCRPSPPSPASSPSHPCPCTPHYQSLFPLFLPSLFYLLSLPSILLEWEGSRLRYNSWVRTYIVIPHLPPLIAALSIIYWLVYPRRHLLRSTETWGCRISRLIYYTFMHAFEEQEAADCAACAYWYRFPLVHAYLFWLYVCIPSMVLDFAPQSWTHRQRESEVIFAPSQAAKIGHNIILSQITCSGNRRPSDSIIL